MNIPSDSRQASITAPTGIINVFDNGGTRAATIANDREIASGIVQVHVSDSGDIAYSGYVSLHVSTESTVL